ncbi:MAG TPA: D-2-hydroxyacid dehydrogenase [Terriglobales bacterium]|nr:D-2-hydroxyacid dehydrogenase [Terriglobales bacterium]
MAPRARVVIAMRSANPAGIWHWPESATAQLARTFPEVAFCAYPRPIDVPLSDAEAAADAELFRDADAVIAWRLDPRLYRRAQRLRWIHCPSAAVHQLLTPELIQSPIVITNGASVHAATVAEHGLALVLALARGLPQAFADQSARRWRPQPWLGGLRRLGGATALLLGMGRIGRELAPRLAALEMHVLGVRRHPERPQRGVAEMHRPEALDELLPRADWLILALPATPATDRIVGAPQLARLPPHAVVVNLGRGPALDEAALASALHAGRLAGAALDVFAHEPLAPDSPLWSAPGCLLTPHVAAAVPDTWQRQTELVGAHLRRFLAGEPLEPLVDKHRGY